MDKQYKPNEVEEKIYQMWEKGGFFTPNIDKSKKPFSILLPLPNANDPMHMGHAVFTIQDILIRYHRMLGDPTLWLPGGDHAGIETQYVFEKKLAKEGKSRFDFDRNTLYKMISEFVEKNKNVNRDQMKKLGFSLDWSRYHYSLEPKIIEIVFDTFRKLHEDKLVYRAQRIVNYCTFCGTAFSDLEVNHIEKEELLYFLDYGLIKVATTRPETIFADVAVAVNPQDKRYKDLIGKEAVVPIIDKKIPIIADSSVEMDFGSGALKVTPAHDKKDFEIGLRHNLPVISCIDVTGQMINTPKEIKGMYVRQAKKKTIELLSNKLVKTVPLRHSVGVCYRCKNIIEPLPIPQWYIKTKTLAKPAIDAVKNNETEIEPLPRFKQLYFDWLNNIQDWNISRQIVWGPRIPVWYCLDCNPDILITFLTKIIPDTDKTVITGKYSTLKIKYTLDEILKGLQIIRTPVDAKYTLNPKICTICKGNKLIQETDTFDTWFLSGQWPLTTLGYPNSDDFKYFYPTSILDTMWDILFFWVARMMMLGIYRTKKPPFKTIHLHARVVDKKGQKMSKSKGNVTDPMEIVSQYGADTLRASLVFGVSPGSDVVITEEKIKGMRNFMNKLWNITRYIAVSIDSLKKGHNLQVSDLEKGTELKNENDKKIIDSLNKIIKNTTHNIEKYRFDLAFEDLYHFLWHEFADNYIESIKNREDKKLSLSVSRHVLLNAMKLLHPFIPFITEEIWSLMDNKTKEPLIVSPWPKYK